MDRHTSMAQMTTLHAASPIPPILLQLSMQALHDSCFLTRFRPRATRSASGASGAGAATAKAARAETKAAHALRMDGENETAQETLRHATALRDEGFRATEEDDVAGEASPLAPAKPW